MSTIIGIDTHIATCDYFAVDESGKRLGEGTFPTGVVPFKKMISEVEGVEKIVVIEQGPLALWIRRILRPVVTKVVVCDPRRNRWIANDSVKNDRFDGEKLTALYRGGFIKEIVQRDESNEALLRLVMTYHDLVRRRTQVKNKLKAKFRENGIRAKGSSLYNESNRKRWMDEIKTNRTLVFPVQILFEQLELLTRQIEQTKCRLKRIVRRYPIIRKLKARFAGVGLIGAATFVALIDTPFRFASEKKLWIYCGLGIDVRSSGIGLNTAKLTIRGNRLWK
jgi:transposase